MIGNTPNDTLDERLSGGVLVVRLSEWLALPFPSNDYWLERLVLIAPCA